LTNPIRKPERESKYTEDAKMLLVSGSPSGEKTLKLKLLFVVMDLLTLLAYLIVFVRSRLRGFSKSRERIPVPNVFVIVPIAPGK
jgi:hypothetical protein